MDIDNTATTHTAINIGGGLINCFAKGKDGEEYSDTTLKASRDGGYYHYVKDGVSVADLMLVSEKATITGASTIEGTVGTAFAEAKSLNVTLTHDTFKASAVGKDAKDWFKDESLPDGLTATVSAVAGKTLTIAITGTPTVASIAPIKLEIPGMYTTHAPENNSNIKIVSADNANARFNIILPTEPSYIPDYNDDPLPATVYNNYMNSRATVALTGLGLSSSDLLITQSEPQGAVYDELRSLAGGYEVVGTYDISLKSGKSGTGDAMDLSFTLGLENAGQDFTLVHRKADGTYEYFYDTADANGNLSFGPLYELSPFLLVKGTLSKAVLPEVPDVTIDEVPKTGDSAQTAALAGMLLIGLLGLGAVYVAKRKRV